MKTAHQTMRNEKDEKEHGPALPKSYAKKNMATTEASPTETRPTEKPAVVRMTFDPERCVSRTRGTCSPNMADTEPPNSRKALISRPSESAVIICPRCAFEILASSLSLTPLVFG